MISHRSVVLALAGVAAALAGLVPAQTLLDPKPMVARPKMPVFASGEGETGPVAASTTQIRITPICDHHAFSAHPGEIVPHRRACGGLFIRVYHSGHHLNFETLVHVPPRASRPAGPAT